MILQILNLTWKEILQLRRDRFLVLFLILAPTLQLVLISRNTSRGLSDLALAVLDLNQSATSRELIAILDNTDEFLVQYFPFNRRQLEELIDEGEAQIGIIIPPNFEQDFLVRTAQVQAYIDGTNILVGSNAGAALRGAIGQLAKRYYAAPVEVDVGGTQVLSSVLFNPTINYQWFAIPSTLAFITYQVALVVAATGFVREKELGTLEQLMITPLRRLELILGKSLPAVIIGVLNFLLLMAVQTLGYHIPVRGNFLLLLAAACLFVIAIVALGTVISVLTQNQQQAVLLVFLFAILEITLSGYLVPIENVPMFMRVLAEISAMQHFMVIMRSISLRGAGLPIIWPHVLAIASFALMATMFAWRSFSRSV